MINNKPNSIGKCVPNDVWGAARIDGCIKSSFMRSFTVDVLFNGFIMIAKCWGHVVFVLSLSFFSLSIDVKNDETTSIKLFVTN